MKRTPNKAVERYRLREGQPGVPAALASDPSDGNNGCFVIPYKGMLLTVIASDGMGWDHVSVSLKTRCPTWEEMAHVKDLFFLPTETVVQFHPKRSEYVNCHEFCLHLWRRQDAEHELPPSMLVGPKE